MGTSPQTSKDGAFPPGLRSYTRRDIPFTSVTRVQIPSGTPSHSPTERRTSRVSANPARLLRMAGVPVALEASSPICMAPNCRRWNVSGARLPRMYSPSWISGSISAFWHPRERRLGLWLRRSLSSLIFYALRTHVLVECDRAWLVTSPSRKIL